MLVVVAGRQCSGSQLVYNFLATIASTASVDQMFVRRDFISQQPTGTKGGNIRFDLETIEGLVAAAQGYEVVVCKTPYLSPAEFAKLQEFPDVAVIDCTTPAILEYSHLLRRAALVGLNSGPSIVSHLDIPQPSKRFVSEEAEGRYLHVEVNEDQETLADALVGLSEELFPESPNAAEVARALTLHMGT